MEDSLKSEKNVIEKIKSDLSGKIAYYNEKIKETEKLKDNLQASIKEHEEKTKDTLAFGSKLKMIAVSIQEILK